ncbi:MAG TPA: YceI family protein [Trebonia sp.]|jgi:polyisoprenoid-binding protein YceI|nr:YceI family protein [Trebonia sp.]
MSESSVGAWVVDPAGSSATFASKTFWGLTTVRGTFGGLAGAGTVAGDGTVSGELVIDAAQLSTKNKVRDQHLRSADFFNVDKFPAVVVRIASTTRDGDTVTGAGTIEAGGQTQPITFTGRVAESDGAVTLTAGATVDHRALGMTWNRLGMLAGTAKGSVTARFVRG